MSKAPRKEAKWISAADARTEIDTLIFRLGMQAGRLMMRKGRSAQRTLKRNFDQARSLGVKIDIDL